MDRESAEIIARAIEKLAEAVERLGDRIANDEPLNYSIARGLQKIADEIDRQPV